MGKVAAEMMKKKKTTKKKGRPSLLDLRIRNLMEQPKKSEQSLVDSSPNSNRRSTRRNPNLNEASSTSDWISGDDEDDERKEKKVKLVVRLPTSNSASYGSDSNADGENSKINASGDRSGEFDAAGDQVIKGEKAMDTLEGSPLESGPTAPLPDKKLLVFILDRLQKKDTYGVFSEPVDQNELPDYHEIIEHPMDFGTVRKNLDDGRYSNLDDFEADVLLICANAMQYNAQDTVYFRQARSIQELAKRDFQNLRQVNDDGEPQPRIVRRGRPPSLKKSLGSPPLERVGPESCSDAILATGGDNNATGSNSYNLRKGQMSFRYQPSDVFYRASPQSRNNETYTDYTTDWNSEFPASILKAEAKYGKKQFSSDESRRATYKQFHPSAFGHDLSALTTLNGNMKQLIGVGLHSEHGYARSLARFAANLGPVVWKITSKKIEKALPSGVKFGPGWVGENEASARPQPVLSSNNMVHGSPQVTPATSEALGGQIAHKEQSVFRNSVSGIDRGPITQTHQKHLVHARNGFNNLSGYDLSFQTEMLRARLAMPTGQQSGLEEADLMSVNHLKSEPNLGSSSSTPHQNLQAPVGPPVAEIIPSQHRQYNTIPVPPDLNVRFQAPGSPSSSFRIGSPQPDLALQL